MVVSSEQITEDIIAKVEEECGTCVGLWDVAFPEEVIAAAFNVVSRELAGDGA